MKTTKEIIKGLEICANLSVCFGCPYKGLKPSCGSRLKKDAADLIRSLSDNKPDPETTQERSFEDTKRSAMEKAARSEQALRCFLETPQEPAQAPEPWTREKVLAEAKRCVCGERDQSYGGPEDSFRTIANLWTAYMTSTCGEFTEFSPVDVAVMMGLLKVARLAINSGHMDSWVDLAGYAACGGEIAGKGVANAAK